MLTLLGFGMVIVFMVLIMTKRLSPLVALIMIPILFALIGGFGGPELGAMMLEGIKTMAPTGVMLMFAILYFGVMIDAGLFDPVVGRIVKAVGGDPLKVVMGTAILAAFVSLDGDGSTTYMIVVASMLPLYKRLGIDPLTLCCVTMLASGVMNLTPWGGPLARAATALHVDPADVFVPLVPSMAAGVAAVILLSWHLGKRERNRLGALKLAPAPLTEQDEDRIADSALLPANGEAEALRRPKLLWVNAALTVALMICLLMGVLPLSVLFMIFFAIAIVINYPNVKQQRARIGAHAANVIAVVSLIFAAGIFTGILNGTGMVKAMSDSLLHVLPDGLGPYLAPITAIASMPFTFFISNDAFYYGVMPVLSEAAQSYGITPVEMARASLIGQPVHLLSPLVPSTYLLVGLAGVEFGDHQRYTIKWAVAICMVLLAVALLLGVFPLRASL
ncbi:MAG TPA: CitMHS family transporter [Xanthomonadaceae bacterium]|nr:CitMHS family transporter [Rhodocyclaceae bacterium]HRQ65157.1 CitMHS family transporter [Xanthomonadaceae bacterium]